MECNFRLRIRIGTYSNDVENALYDIINTTLKQEKFKHRKIASVYEGYLYRLHHFDPELYVKILAKKIIQDDAEYDLKCAQAYSWYPNDIATKIDKLYIILRNISRENA